MIRLGITLAAVLAACPAWGAEYRASVLSVYDGDTITVSIDGKVDRVRVENIDAPEIDGKCQAEKHIAAEARDFARQWVGSNVVLITGKRERDQYGRLLARVSNDEGADLGEALIRAGLARKWTGKRRPWCGQ